jgi:hypothetical protein
VLAIALMLVRTGPTSAQVPITEKTIGDQGAGYEMRFAYPQTGNPSADAAMQDWVQALADGFKRVLPQRDSREPPYFAQLRYAVARNDEAAVSILFS